MKQTGRLQTVVVSGVLAVLVAFVADDADLVVVGTEDHHLVYNVLFGRSRTDWSNGSTPPWC